MPLEGRARAVGASRKLGFRAAFFESAQGALRESFNMTTLLFRASRSFLTPPMRLLVTLLFCFLLSAPWALARPKAEEPIIVIRPGATLYVHVMDSIDPINNLGEMDRFIEFKQVFEEVMELVDFPLDCEIDYVWGRRMPPKDEPRLDLTIMRWGETGYGELEVRFMAGLQLGYEKSRLGVFLERDGSATLFSSMRARKAYNDLMRKALLDMMRKLDERVVFETPLDGQPGGESDLPLGPEARRSWD